MQDNSIARLGFDAWADNIIVNVIENDPPLPFKWEDSHGMTVAVTRQGNDLHGVVRAYYHGWQTHERTIQNKFKK